MAQPTQLNCFLCKKVFGVPPGAKLTKCPHCLTINPTDAQPLAQPTGRFGVNLGNINLGFGSSNTRLPVAKMQNV